VTRFGSTNRESKLNRTAIVLSLAALLSLAAAPSIGAETQAPPAYRITKAVPLGAPDRWDYVVFDPSSHRVFVAHGDRVTVVDGRGGKVLGEVAGIAGGTHGIAISAATGKGVTDDGRAGEAVIFDLKTFAVLTRLTVEKDADAIAFDPASGHVFVIEGDPKKVTVIDPATNSVIATIDGGGGLEYAAADGRGSLFVAGVEKRDVVRIDTRANTVAAHWPIPDCAAPHGLAVDPQAHRVFVSCVNQRLVAVDTDTGREVAGVAIGKGTDAAAFDPRRKLVFSSNGSDGTLSVIREKDSNTFLPLATVATAVSGRTMSIDPESGRIYIAAADVDPSPTPGGRPRPRPGTLKLLFLDPAH
jgi:YVTN family beta-propeller protein